MNWLISFLTKNDQRASSRSRLHPLTTSRLSMRLTLPLWEKSKAAFSADMTLLMRKSQQRGYRYRRRSVSHTYTELISTYSLNNTDSNIQNLHGDSRRRSWRPTRRLSRRQKGRAVFISPQKHRSVACNKQQNCWFHFTLSLRWGSTCLRVKRGDNKGKKKAALKTWIPRGRRTLVQDVSSRWAPKS